jgi:hypothetical protein
MPKPDRRWIALVVMAMLAVAVWLTSGPPSPATTAPGTFAFAALGDAPYYWWEDLKFRQVKQDLNQHDLTFVIHIGDVFWRPCTDRHYQSVLDEFNQLRYPVIYTPGDNEWTDCWERPSGGFAPLERLASLRKIFFANPAESAGGRRLPLETQSTRPDFAEFVENARWSHAGVTFATVHLVGSSNAQKAFPDRKPEDDEAVVRRTKAAAAWLTETFAAATAGGAPAIVIAFHGAPGFNLPADNRHRQSFEPFLDALEVETERFGRPVFVIHGDDHHYTVDQPLRRRTTGQPLANLTRLMVPGSPAVGWVRVVVTPGATTTFSPAARVVPQWKYW